MLLHTWLFNHARTHPDADALSNRKQTLSYAELAHDVRQLAAALDQLGLQRGQRLAFYLPKQFEVVTTLLAASCLGLVFVPINPLLKPGQVRYILQDCGVSVLLTSAARMDVLASVLSDCACLHTVIRTDTPSEYVEPPSRQNGISWEGLTRVPTPRQPALTPVIDLDLAAILYTSGSTGQPKGVMLSQRNLVCGASSVAAYLGNTAGDRILAVLPFSFDYGLSQLTTALQAGACCVLMDYLLPRDVIKAIVCHRITGLAAVPSLWIQLAQLEWPAQASESLRYITNSGGKLPMPTTRQLRQSLPNTQVFLMYGLTEAFRSTYLPPNQLDQRPDSIGQAIPNAEILVVRPDGRLCADHEPGELVHRGSLVAMGYWNNARKTAERFRPAPCQPDEMPQPEIAVWSGDTVVRDEAGYLYFLQRQDDLIKTSGYRVSPTEVEAVLYASGQVSEAVVLGAPHPLLGQAIVAVVAGLDDQSLDARAVMAYCKQALPGFMQPLHLAGASHLPKTPNGKVDRSQLAQQFAHVFLSAAERGPDDPE